MRAARSLLPGALHRHSVGALTRSAAFPVTASAFAIAWTRQRAADLERREFVAKDPFVERRLFAPSRRAPVHDRRAIPMR
jgi:hypothetical protein